MIAKLKKDKGPFSHIRLDIDRQKMLITEIAFLDPQGQVKMKMTFNNISINSPLPKGTFRYTSIKNTTLTETKE